MKDKNDKSTGNLLSSPGAKRQAALKARRESDGLKRLTVWIKQADFEAGQLAAELNSTNASECPLNRDRLSWMLGYCKHLEKANAHHRNVQSEKEASRSVVEPISSLVTEKSAPQKDDLFNCDNPDRIDELFEDD
jgi:hypothetical protein